MNDKSAYPDQIRAPRFDEFEAYRGIAALMIVVFHAYQFSRQASRETAYVYEGTVFHNVFGNMDVGVAWFFALSGFLLFLPIARASLGIAEMQPVRAFLIKRAIRILPLYYVAIILVWTWRYSGQREQWVDLFRHLTFTHIFDPVHLFWTIGPAWSLAVEVHFYVLLALLAPLIVRLCLAQTQKGAAVGLFAGTIAVWIGGLLFLWLAAFVWDIPESNAPVWFSLASRLDNFAIGMMLAVVAALPNRRLHLGSGYALLVRVLGFALILMVFATRTVDSIPHALQLTDVYFHSASAAAFGLVLASTVLGPRSTRYISFVSMPALTWLGIISYSVYIWHEPIMIELGSRNILLRSSPDWFLVNALTLAVLSILAGLASYLLIERPTIELRHLFDKRGRLVDRYERDSVKSVARVPSGRQSPGRSDQF